MSQRRRAAAAAMSLLLAACASSGPDPWERSNRAVFGFNRGLDRFVLEPVAIGWDFAFPELAQRGISNFFENLDTPVVILNDLLYPRPLEFVQDVGRLIVNSTFGIGGLIDAATIIGIPRNDADFGLTLGRYRVPAGPYVMLPIFGPSSVRDGFGLLADSVSRPHGYFVPFWASAALWTVDMVNTRAVFLEELRQAEAEAFDYYVFVRNAFLQNRRRKLGRAEPEEEIEDLYYFEEESFEDELEAGSAGP